MKIPAKLDGEVHFVPLEDILYITIYDKKIMFYTKEHVFYALNTVKDYLDLTKEYGFDLLDRNNVVQVDKIKRYDPIQKIVFFGGCGSRYCTVSGKNLDFLKNLKD